MKRKLAYLKDVYTILDAGGLVRMTWVNGKVELTAPSGKMSVIIDGRTYQGFLNDKRQATLTRTETGSAEEKNLIIEWRKK